MIQLSVRPAVLPPTTLDYVIETLPSGIILLDAEHRILSANAKGRAYLSRLTHSKVGELLTHLGGARLSLLLASSTSDDQPTTLHPKESSLGYYAMTVHALPAATDHTRWMLVLQEGTAPSPREPVRHQRLVQRNADRRRLERQLRVSKGKLYQLAVSIVTLKHAMSAPPAPETAPAHLAQHTQARIVEMRMINAQLARAVRLKDQFWGNMSHELRTPLSAILLNGELLQRNLFGTLTPKQTQYVQRMMDSTNHLLALINDILDLTRTDAGYVELTRTPGDIRQFCLTSIELIKERAQQKRINIAFEWDEQATSLQVDELRFKQILVNLLTNAVKFTPEKGKIGLKVTADQATNAVYFAVWDTGLGIAEAEIPRLFQRFIKHDSGTFPHAYSTGLGLALVVQLTRLHGGNIDVDSTLGSGSCFTVGLPWLQSALAEAQPVSAAVTDLVPQRASFVHQLSDAAQVLATALVEQNVCLVIEQQADNLAEQVQGIAPDLIFLDLTLDDAVGWRMLPTLVEVAKAAQAPVIVLDDINAFANAQRMGADLCLGKPLTRSHVQTALSTVLPHGSVLRTALLLMPAMVNRPLARILVIDDMSLTGSALADYLFAMGYDVAIATTHVTALALAQKIKPHLVLLDLQMPSIDSVMMTQQLRALPSLNNLPVIALTALTMPDDRERLWAAGMNGYLSKPLHLGKLLSTIEQFLPKPGYR